MVPLDASPNKDTPRDVKGDKKGEPGGVCWRGHQRGGHYRACGGSRARRECGFPLVFFWCVHVPSSHASPPALRWVQFPSPSRGDGRLPRLGRGPGPGLGGCGARTNTPHRDEAPIAICVSALDHTDCVWADFTTAPRLAQFCGCGPGRCGAGWRGELALERWPL